MYNQEKEAGDEGNNVTASAILPLYVHELATDATPSAGTLSPDDRADYYQVEVDPQANLNLVLDSLSVTGANEIYIAYERIPTRYDYEYRDITCPPPGDALHQTRHPAWLCPAVTGSRETCNFLVVPL